MFSIQKALMKRSVRCFSGSSGAQADLIQSLYVQQLKAYKPLPKSAVKAEIPETFSLPKAPAAPAFDKTELKFESSALAKDTEWPPLENHIDNPENFNGMSLFS
jgi:hypothetical protein